MKPLLFRSESLGVQWRGAQAFPSQFGRGLRARLLGKAARKCFFGGWDGIFTNEPGALTGRGTRTWHANLNLNTNQTFSQDRTRDEKVGRNQQQLPILPYGQCVY